MTIVKGKIRAAFTLALVLAVASGFTLSSLAASSPSNAAASVRVEDPATAFVGKLTGTGQLTIDGEAAQPGATVVSGSRVATGAESGAVIDLGTLGQIGLRSNTAITLTFTAGVVSLLLDGAGTIDGSLTADVTCKVQTAGARLHLAEGEAKLRSASGVRWLHAGEAVALTADAEAVIAGSATFTAAGDATVAEKRASEQSATEPPASQTEAQNHATTTATEGNSSTPASPSGTTTAIEGGSSGPASSNGTPTMPSPRGRVTTAGIGGVIAMVGVATGVAVGVMAGSSRSGSSATVRPSTVTP
jgi:hypothetical protein